MVNFSATKVLSTLVNPDKILPVAIIEASATAGRTYQGYKRGGKEEGSERLREESISAVFWLFGVKVLNKIGDFLGKKIGIEYMDIDLGRDELRAPYLNIPEAKRFKTCAFKFGKIISSAAIATILMGFILPKINHAITNASRKKRGLEPIPEMTKKKKDNTKNQETVSYPTLQASNPFTIEGFVEASKNNAKGLSFGGGLAGTFTDIMARGSHNLENKTAWRLFSTDVGMIAGRVVNSRNKVEAAEFLFRDTASIYFYLFATPHIAALLTKLTGSTPIHPDSLEVVKKHLINSMNGAGLDPDDFLKQARQVPDDVQSILSSVPFDKKGIVGLDEFNKATNGAFAKRAGDMSKMQPLMNGKALLSRQQAEFALSGGWCREADFLIDAVNKGTYGLAGNKNKFVQRKTVENICSSVDTFVDNLVKYAKSKGKNISADTIETFAKRTARANLAFRIAGMAFAGFGLAYLIPKIQYKLTELKTGSKQFPGTADYSDCLNVNNADNAKVDVKPQTA